MTAAEEAQRAASGWFRRSRCAAFACIRQYDPERFNAVTLQARAAASESTPQIPAGDSRWDVEFLLRPAGEGADAVDLEATFRCLEGVLPHAAVAVELEFGEWSADNYVLLPAAAYNGNRFLSRRIPYSPKLHFPQDIGPDVPVIISDVPRLNAGEGPSRIQERSGSMARPAIGFRAAQFGTGVWLLTAQGNRLGDYGLGIEETRGREMAILSVSSPVVRELHSYRICDSECASQDRPADFRAGDEVTIRLRLHAFAAPSTQALFDKFAEIRRELLPVLRPKPVLPFSACWLLQKEKFNRENFVPEHGYYAVGPRTNFLQDWQIGWTGGMISTYPLLFAGGAATRRNVLRNFDWLFPEGISPSGFFWDSCAGGTQWIGGDIRKPHTGNWHLIRKSGDAVFYILKQFTLMRRLGTQPKPAWLDGTRRVCDALVEVWTRCGQFGQFVDSRTGEVCVGGSTSGAIVPAALTAASHYFGEARYLEVAVAAAEKFYREFTQLGLSCGGPGDALQNPDSESWYSLIESYVALFDATGDANWLTRAAETSRQFATWVVAYDFQFPAGSMFGKAGIHATGSVYANTQNKHSAPGLCTFSGLGLLKLFRATGDRAHLDLLREIAFGLPQYLPHPLRPLGDAKPGWMCERVNLTDWEGPERIGETLRMTTWAETSLMLTTIEIPGLYVQPDRSVVAGFDNILVETLCDSAAEIVVRLHNPTVAAALVKIFSESGAEAAKPLPDNYLFGCRTVELQPGDSTSISFPKV